MTTSTLKNPYVNAFWPRFLAAFGLELRLIVRHWSYWLVNALYAAFFVSSLGDLSQMFTARENLLGGFSRSVTALICLIALYLAGFSAGRARRNRFDALEGAFPTNAEVLIGRCLAVAAACLSFLIAPLAIAFVGGPLASFWLGAPTFILECVLVILFTTGLIWLIEATVGIRRWMFPLLSIIWLGGTTLPIILQVNGLPVPGAGLLNFGRGGYGSYSELWGRLQMGGLPVLFNAFYVAIIGLIFGVIVWRITKLRSYRRSQVALAVMSAAGVFALGTAVAYAAEVARTNAQIMAEYSIINNGFTVVVNTKDAVFPADAPYAATGYDLTLDVAAQRVNAQMEIVNQSDAPVTTLELTLYRQFEVTEASLPFERQDDVLRFTLPEALAPGEAIQIALTYQGALWKFEPSGYGGAPPEPVGGFLRPDGVYLPYSAGWYPVPGRFSLSGLSTLFARPEQPARFQVTIENSGDLKFASNLVRESDENAVFSSEGATWVELLGAPRLEKQQIGAVTVYAGADAIDNFVAAAEAVYAPTMEHLGRFFPDNTNTAHLTLRSGDRITSSPMTLWTGTPPTAEGLNAVVELRVANHLVESPLEEYRNVTYALLLQLFGEYRLDRRGATPLIDNVGLFLWAHRKANGDPARMRSIVEAGIEEGQLARMYYAGEMAMPGQAEAYPAATALIDLYETSGEEAVRMILQQMQTEYETLYSLSAEELAARIQTNTITSVN